MVKTLIDSLGLVEPTSVLPLSVFRVFFGASLLYSIVGLAQNRHTWFGGRGVLPPALQSRYCEQKLFHLTKIFPRSSAALDMLFVLYVTAALGLMVGYHAQLCSMLCFAFTVAFQHRNPLIFYGPDSLQKILLFLTIFLPTDRALSVHSLILHGELIAKESLLINAWMVFLPKVQIAIMYIHSALWKVSGPDWRNGSALRRILQNPRYIRGSSLPHLYLRLNMKYLGLTIIALELLVGTTLLVCSYSWTPVILGVVVGLVLKK